MNKIKYHFINSVNVHSAYTRAGVTEWLSSMYGSGVNRTIIIDCVVENVGTDEETIVVPDSDVTLQAYIKTEQEQKHKAFANTITAIFGCIPSNPCYGKEVR